jgi:hypothetical protein
MKMLCLSRFNVHSIFSTFDSRLGYFDFSLLRTVFSAFSQAVILVLCDITAMLFFKLNCLKHFFGYNRPIIPSKPRGTPGLCEDMSALQIER